MNAIFSLTEPDQVEWVRKNQAGCACNHKRRNVAGSQPTRKSPVQIDM